MYLLSLYSQHRKGHSREARNLCTLISTKKEVFMREVGAKRRERSLDRWKDGGKEYMCGICISQVFRQGRKEYLKSGGVRYG